MRIRKQSDAHVAVGNVHFGRVVLCALGFTNFFKAVARAQTAYFAGAVTVMRFLGIVVARTFFRADFVLALAHAKPAHGAHVFANVRFRACDGKRKRQHKNKNQRNNDIASASVRK